MDQVVECLPSKWKALSSNPNIVKKKEKKNKEKHEDSPSSCGVICGITHIQNSPL
jgi:hypothetical protein